MDGMRIRNPNRLWHYTIANYLPSILTVGELWLADCEVPADERPAVWFSANPVWEPTAAKAYEDENGFIPATKDVTERYGGGLVRIAVAHETAPVHWPAFRLLSGIPPKRARALALAGKRTGANPYDWYASFEPVLREKWLGIEWWFGNRWRPCDIEVVPGRDGRQTLEAVLSG